MHSDLILQKRKFNENMLMKKYGNDIKISPSPLNLKRKTVIFPVNESPSLLFDIDNRMRRSLVQPNSDRQNKRKINLLKSFSIPNKKQSISDIFEEYFKKFHYLYFHIFCEKQCIDIMEKINENYKEKLECFIFFEDQIKELALLTTGDSGHL